MNKVCILFALIFSNISFGQDSLAQTVFVDTFQTNQFLATVESSLFEYYKETWGKEKAYAIIDELGYDEKTAITFSDSVYVQRLNKIISQTPFTSPANATILKTTKYFISKRRRFTSVVIGKEKLIEGPVFEVRLSIV